MKYSTVDDNRLDKILAKRMRSILHNRNCKWLRDKLSAETNLFTGREIDQSIWIAKRWPDISRLIYYTCTLPIQRCIVN